MDTEQNPVRIALVGLGSHGRTIQQAVEEAGNFRVVAVYDPNEQEARLSADRFRCEAASSYEEILARGDAEAVSLVTPNHVHRAQAEAAFRSGLHVFLEKPIANTVADGLAIVRAAEEAERVLMIGHNMRFGTAARRAKQALDAGRLGRIVSAEFHFSSDSIKRFSGDTWRLHPDHCPLLPVMQLGVHAIDLMHYLIGPIAEVHAIGRTVLAPAGVVDSVSGVFRFEEGIVGTMVSNYCTPVLFEYRIVGTEGSLRCTPHDFSYWSATPDGIRTDADDQNFGAEGIASYSRQMRAFGEAVRGGAEPEVDGLVGIRALAVVEAMQLSVETGLPQKVTALHAGINV